MAEGSAPRSSELRRSDDYSGPSSFLASFLAFLSAAFSAAFPVALAASSPLVSYPFGTVHR